MSRHSIALIRLQTENERLRDYVLVRAQCPCCDELAVCHEECTFKHDCPDEYIDIEAARAALYDRQEMQL